MFCEADFCRKAKQKHFLWLSQWLCVYLSTGLGTTRVVIKINGHGDKQSSKFSNLNNVNIKSAETKQQNRLKQCFP